MTLPALLVVAVAANFAPEIISGWTGTSIKAWEYVANGAALAALWTICGAYVEREPASNTMRVPMMAICAYGAFEAAQRPACRLLFPMDRAPVIISPDGLCAAAGIPTYWLSPVLIGLLACLIAARLPVKVDRPKLTNGS